MITAVNTEHNASFRAIQLSVKEAEKAQSCINKLLDFGLPLEKKQNIKNAMFNTFSSHLKNEAKCKTSHFRLFKDVLSEIYLKFSELLEDIKENPDLETFIKKIEEYRPTKDTMKSEYIHKSLDAPLRDDKKSKTLADFILEKDLPKPISAIDREKLRNKIDSTIIESRLSTMMERRLQKRADGIKYADIAKEEKVRERTISESVRKGILRIKKQNNTLPQEYIDNAKILAKSWDCSEEKMLKVLLQHTDLLYKKTERIMQDVKKAADSLGCSEKKFAKAALLQPALFGMNPETILQHAKLSSKIFGCSEKDFIKVAISKNPALLTLNPETLKNNINKSSSNIECTKEEFIKAGMRDPTILYLKPETLLKHIKESSNSLNCSVKDFVKVALKQPILFYCNADTLNKNVKKASELLGCSFDQYVQAALKQGTMLYQKPAKTKSNIQRSAEFLHISEKEFVSIALKHPPLFVQKPETLKENAEKMAKILNISINDYFKKIKGKPSILSQKPETLESKLKINAYYYKIKNEKSLNTIAQDSNDKLYSKILAYLVQQLKNKEFDSLVKVMKYFNIENFLRVASNKNFYFEIPADEVARDFTKYVQEISIKTIGRNIFEFKILEDSPQ